jgi:putative phosphoribosyl transferase
LRGLADEVVCLRAPADFVAVGQWYRSFGQTTDDEVDQLLADASHEP